MIPLPGREGGEGEREGGAGIRALDHAGGLILYHIVGGDIILLQGANIINRRVQYQSGGQILWIRGSGVCVCAYLSSSLFFEAIALWNKNFFTGEADTPAIT